MLNQRYTVKKDFEDFHKEFPELVLGSSFTVTGTDGTGIISITMDSGTEYHIEQYPWCWCFYTEDMTQEYLTPVENLSDEEKNELMVANLKKKEKEMEEKKALLLANWEKKEKELIEALENHRKNKPGV
ncbi:hypothetical protein [Aeromonas phage AS-zj]|uniref:Uncharacterized protein n=2 Tax=Ceceduovirus aszj TaxID=2843652 RepID=A0A291LCY7_9CAUD|nr:hypothetical protein HWB28_gp218 [Aeromonas phage AS-zj]ASU00334.1 hypothetical protein [Aeromonas phage AS-zj]ATI17257.1 hypothetical protein [Aeromonas phage AS-szw]